MFAIEWELDGDYTGGDVFEIELCTNGKFTIHTTPSCHSKRLVVIPNVVRNLCFSVRFLGRLGITIIGSDTLG